MAEIQRPGALYRQVAAAIRDAIATGEFPPGTPLPSEAQLIDRYQVSRPTVRNAIAALRAEGLINVIHGKGSFVRNAPASVTTIEQTITRDRKGTYTTSYHGWELAEEPSFYRTQTTAETGPLLNLHEEEEAFGADRLFIDPDTGTRLAHRVIIPLATADKAEALAEQSNTAPERIYAILTEAGHQLWWRETARARMPLPDERTTLQLPDATPVLHTMRITYGTDDQPLILEELRANGDRTQAAYRITADIPSKLRAVRD